MVTSDCDRFVFVALPGQCEYVIAGRYRVSGEPGSDPLGEFVYGRSYLDRREAVELDPVQLRLTERVRRTSSSDGLFGAIRDADPTSWGRPVAQRSRERKVAGRFDHWDQLRTERPGAVVVARGPGAPRPTPRMMAFDELVSLMTVQDEERDAHGETPVAQALGPAIRITPKVTVERERTLWVAKITNGHSVWNQARVRHATLQLARDCGLDVLPSRVERVAGGEILLVPRPDREWVGDGYACSRLISGLTLLGTDDTPEERLRWSHLTLADEVRRTSSRPREDLRELFRRICFNAAISNLNDDLLRPMMVAKARGWRLIKASGPVPTPPVEGARREFAMICGPAGRSPSRENLVGGAGRFLLDREAAEAVFDTIHDTVRSSWHAVMRRSGVSAADREVVARSIARDDEGS